MTLRKLNPIKRAQTALLTILATSAAVMLSLINIDLYMGPQDWTLPWLMASMSTGMVGVLGMGVLMLIEGIRLIRNRR